MWNSSDKSEIENQSEFELFESQPLVNLNSINSQPIRCCNFRLIISLNIFFVRSICQAVFLILMSWLWLRFCIYVLVALIAVLSLLDIQLHQILNCCFHLFKMLIVYFINCKCARVYFVLKTSLPVIYIICNEGNHFADHHAICFC